ncbi:MAG: energy transducer TonB [Hyphomicrobiaceae bacterium]
MNALRVSSLLLSAALHGSLLVTYLDFAAGGRSLEQGTGNDLLRIEQGIALEGLTRLGEAPESIEAREVVEQQASIAQPELEEVKTTEAKPEEPPPEDVPQQEKPPELKDIITSPLGPTQEIVTAPPPKEVQRPQPKQVATEERIEQVAVLEQKASSQSQEGGDATLYRAYLGSIRSHIEKFKVKPKAREKGTVVVRFTVDRDGNVTDRTVATSSGSAQLDEAALAAVEKAAPFPRFPKEIDREQIVLSLPFRFVLR